MGVSTKQTSSKNTTLTNQNTIHIKGARSNNLKNLELEIPKNKLKVSADMLKVYLLMQGSS